MYKTREDVVILLAIRDAALRETISAILRSRAAATLETVESEAAFQARLLDPSSADRPRTAKRPALILMQSDFADDLQSLLRALRERPEVRMIPIVILRCPAVLDEAARQEEEDALLHLCELGVNAVVRLPEEQEELENRMGAVCRFWLGAATLPVESW